MTVKLTDLHSLPICPSSNTLRNLPPSQRATILGRISSALFYTLSLPDEKLSRLSCNDFIASYIRQEATQVLNSIIFPFGISETERRSAHEKDIRRRVLSLVLRLAGLQNAGGLTLQSILDICVVYAPKNNSRVTNIVEQSVNTNPTLLEELHLSAVPSFASILLSSNSGLHALRKVAFCLKCFLQSSPAPVLERFLQDHEFFLALAQCYDARLSAIAMGYGGINIDRPDDSETAELWVRCKIELIDCLHTLLEYILKSVYDNPRANVERAVGLVFTLLNVPSTSGHSPASQIPFLNRTLLADYQDAYNLSSTLSSILSNNDDPRLDFLEATLKSFESETSLGDRRGALKLVLHSGGVPSIIDRRGAETKGKERAPPPEPDLEGNADLDAAVSNVLDVLPDQEPAYIHALLLLQRYKGSPERVIAALLEGDAPPLESLKTKSDVTQTSTPMVRTPLPERRNIFNEQPIEAANIQIGKRREDADILLQDRAFLDQMKEDILRRAAELSDSDEEHEDAGVNDADDLESVLDSGVKVVADREDIEGDSDDDNNENHERQETPTLPQTPETICELSYTKNPKVFDRDADTRRSKARADLKACTGWTDEQLEGWRIMLERNPKKDKILLKHQFSANKKGPILGLVQDEGASSSADGRGHSQGRGRGSGGRGRGGGRRGGGADGPDARERAWKDKNKMRQANHNRKRGHDRKMARGGAIPTP